MGGCDQWNLPGAGGGRGLEPFEDAGPPLTRAAKAKAAALRASIRRTRKPTRLERTEKRLRIAVEYLHLILLETGMVGRKLPGGHRPTRKTLLRTIRSEAETALRGLGYSHLTKGRRR